MSFIDPSDIATYLGTTFDAGQLARVQILIDAMQASIEISLGYALTRSTRTATFDGGQRRVWLPEPSVAIDFSVPVVVTIYNDTVSLYEPWLGTVTRLRTDGSLDLYSAGYGPDAVQITYTAGWEDNAVPADLKQALIELVAAKWSVATAVSEASSTGTDAPIKSISIGTLKKEFAIGADTSSVTSKLQTQATAALDTIQTYNRVRAY